MNKKTKIITLICSGILVLLLSLYYYFFIYGFNVSTSILIDTNVKIKGDIFYITADTANSGYVFAGYDTVWIVDELLIKPRYSIPVNSNRNGKLEIIYDTKGRTLDKIFLVGITEDDKKQIWLLEETIYKKVNDLDGVSLKTSKSTYENNVDEICFIFENNTDKEYTFGSQYQLEKFEDGKWHQLFPDEDEILWTLEGYRLKPNSIRKEILNLSWIYGNYFENGIYRIVKGIHLRQSDVDFDMFYLTAEFKIT